MNTCNEEDYYLDDSDWDDSPIYEEDDPWGCCDHVRCLNPHYHHRISECFFAEDCYDPSRWEIFLWRMSEFWRRPFSHCCSCGKRDRFLWFWCGKHKECVPF